MTDSQHPADEKVPTVTAAANDTYAFVTAFFGGLMAYDTNTFTRLNDISNPIHPATGFTDVVVQNGTVYAVNFDVDAMLIVDPSSRSVIGDLLVRDGPIAIVAYPR